MKLSDLHSIIRVLHEDRVKYLLVGGLAVVAHGYGRMTYDADIVVKLDPQNIIKAFKALARIGYRSRLPITAEQFADKATRDGWIRDKGMVVLNMWSDSHRETPVDLFVDEPFVFDDVYNKAPEESLQEGIPFRFADIDTLIQMKRKAGREKDMDDIRHLEMIADEC